MFGSLIQDFPTIYIDSSIAEGCLGGINDPRLKICHCGQNSTTPTLFV